MKGLYLAADVSLRQATKLLDRIGDQFEAIKTHMLTDSAARERVKILKKHGAKRLWKDFKGHDTPDTVAGRAREFQKAGVDIVTVHASGGLEMMRQTVQTGLTVYAVVFLTSLTNEQFARYYQPNAVENMIEDAMEAGIAGFICPPKKVAWMRDHLKQFPRRAVIVSPGTRFVGADANDQQQVEAPGVTIAKGADYLVVGRMATAAKDPVAAMAKLRAEIDAAIGAEGVI
jgi:orotidine-5'-phosphate decarboxylase